ncbi:MAG: hypothetical protein A3H45_02550 [Ignavibacteria bacterium RIFCSPLOWO2_02_FULL_55_14]|nr:MAG: hypothetical protein A3H45_02550 [Ignavibacteria bacterium RIFCSPLOWO2_02_FULL_55_14]
MTSRWILRGVGLVLSLVSIVLISSAQVGQQRTIQEIQQVSDDSLALLQSQQASARFSLDETQYAQRFDTVRVTGVVLVRPRILTYTLARYNIFIQDTATGAVWAGLNVLTNDTSDAAKSTDITTVDSGDVITVTGRVLEFPTASTSQPNSLTEIYLYNVGSPATFTSPQQIQYHTTIPRPDPVELTVDSFSTGTVPKNTIGEKYEGMYVVIRNVTVNSISVANGDFTFVDTLGNQMRMYDGSGWYTLRGHKISGSRYSPPPVGTVLKYIRGVILPQARTGTGGEYTIMPMYPGPSQQTGSSYPGDIVVDKFAPSITEVTRMPGVPTSTDQVTVTFRAKDLNTNGGVDSAFIFVRNAISGPYTRTKLTLAEGDSLYRATISLFANNTHVAYFAAAYSGGGFGMFPDSTIPYFYAIRDAGLSVYDVQYTPYSNGLSGFIGDTVTVAGIVTADTTDIAEIPATGTGSLRPRVWIAEAAGAWRGVVMYGVSASVGVDTVKRGDSLSVTGIVRETNGRPAIEVLSRTVHATGRPVPSATTISVSGFGSVSYELSNPPTSGNPTFEQWEGVLVNVNNVYVVNRNADNPLGTASSNFGEFMVSPTNLPSSSSRFGLRVDDNGRNSYYADTSSGYLGVGGRYYIDHPGLPPRTSVLNLSWKISSLKAIFDFSFSFYKLEPRKDDDYGTLTGAEMVSDVPESFSLSQNYPNPFNPTTSIRYTLPFESNVTIRVFNLLGQEVATLAQGVMASGTYVATFDATRLTTGVYFCQLRAGDFVALRKMVLLK